MVAMLMSIFMVCSSSLSLRANVHTYIRTCVLHQLLILSSPQVLHVTATERDVSRGKVLRYEKEVRRKVRMYVHMLYEYVIVAM